MQEHDTIDRPLSPSILSAAAVLRGGLCRVERLVKALPPVYERTQDAHVKPTDCRDAPHGNVLGKARAV
jgi:hypothetical protein